MNDHPAGGAWQSTSSEAAGLVFGDRGRRYSHPFDDYSSVLTIVEAIVPDNHRGTVVGAVMHMIAVKLARIRYGLECDFPPDVLRDSIVDTSGYLDCLFGVLERMSEINDEQHGTIEALQHEGVDR